MGSRGRGNGRSIGKDSGKDKTLDKFGISTKGSDELEEKMVRTLNDIGEEIKKQLKLQQEQMMQEFYNKLEERDKQWERERDIWKEEKEELIERIKILEWEKEKKRKREKKVKYNYKRGRIRGSQRRKNGRKSRKFYRKEIERKGESGKCFFAKKRKRRKKGKSCLNKIRELE